MRWSTYCAVCRNAKFASGKAIDAVEIGAEHERYRNKRTLKVSACSMSSFPAIYALVSGVQAVAILRSDIGR